jgi:hypothetical protein
MRGFEDGARSHHVSIASRRKRRNRPGWCSNTNTVRLRMRVAARPRPVEHEKPELGARGQRPEGFVNA